MRTRKGAFTLVELLVVIAILGVLAGLLLPVLAKVRERGRVVKAQSDISMIAAACTSYSRTWGCFPPDLMPGAASEHPNTPNECLVFFANTAFKPSSSDGNENNDDPGTPLAGFLGRKFESFGTKEEGPELEIKRKYLLNYDNGNFYSAMDPWGLPYFYNAPGGAHGDPRHSAAGVDIFSVGGNGKTAQGTIDVRNMYDSNQISAADWTTIMGDFKSGNDVDPSAGGNSYTGSYDDNDTDDINNW